MKWKRTHVAFASLILISIMVASSLSNRPNLPTSKLVEGNDVFWCPNRSGYGGGSRGNGDECTGGECGTCGNCQFNCDSYPQCQSPHRCDNVNKEEEERKRRQREENERRQREENERRQREENERRQREDEARRRREDEARRRREEEAQRQREEEAQRQREEAERRAKMVNCQVDVRQSHCRPNNYGECGIGKGIKYQTAKVVREAQYGGEPCPYNMYGLNEEKILDSQLPCDIPCPELPKPLPIIPDRKRSKPDTTPSPSDDCTLGSKFIPNAVIKNKGIQYKVNYVLDKNKNEIKSEDGKSLTGDLKNDEEIIEKNCNNSAEIMQNYTRVRVNDTKVDVISDAAGMKDRDNQQKSYIDELRDDMTGGGFIPKRPARAMDPTDMFNAFKDNDGTQIGLGGKPVYYKLDEANGRFVMQSDDAIEKSINGGPIPANSFVDLN